MRSPKLTTEDFYNGLPLPQHPIHRTAYRTDMLERIHSILQEMCTRHNKALFIRFDLNLPIGTPNPTDNTLIGSFMDRLTQNLKRRKLDPRYFYRREIGDRCGRVHYHAVLLLDGNKVQRIKRILSKIERLWGEALGVDPRGLVHYCNPCEGQLSNGIQLRRHDPEFEKLFAHCFAWAAYLAKHDSGETTPHKVRSFNASRLR